MACLFYGLYAWNWDAPALAKCSIGIPSGVVAVVLGALQINTAKTLRISSRVNVDGFLCLIKILNCLLILLALLVVGISVYLIFVLWNWVEVDEEEYQFFIQGPVSAALMLNSCQGVVAVLQLIASFAGIAMKDF